MPNKKFSLHLFSTLAVMFLLFTGGNAFAVTGKTIHNFQSLQNGANPQSSLMLTRPA